MRDATKIKQIADLTIQLIQNSSEAQLERDHAVISNLTEISRIAGELDARTGKHDSSYTGDEHD